MKINFKWLLFFNLFLLGIINLSSQNLCKTFLGSYKQVGFNAPASPLYKAGWNLIFNDEFNGNSLDAVKWNKSNNLDDGYHNCLHDIVFDPANVSVADGNLRMMVTAEEFAGCPNSGAEIKSYSILDPNFKSIVFYPDSYIEIRVKGLPFAKGLGSAFWMFVAGHGDAEYREIDIWETYDNKKNILKTNYHWDYGDESIFGGESEKIHLYKDLFLTPYNLDEEWMNIGCEWHHNSIRYYLNNTLIRELEITGFNSDGILFEPINRAMNIRLSMQSTLCAHDGDNEPVDRDALPKSMFIDYIRVYKQASTVASPFILMPNSVCYNNSGFNVTCAFYPEAIYNWESDAFDFSINAFGHPSGQWATLKPDIVSGNNYDITLTVIFPEGYTETQTRSIYVSEEPVTPFGDIETKQIGNSCDFSAVILHPHPEEIILWSENNGTSWHEGESFYEDGKYWNKYGTFLRGNTYNILLKLKNPCGESESSSPMEFTTPTPIDGCWLKSDIVSQELTPHCYGEFLIYGNEFSFYSESLNVNIFNLTGEMVFTSKLDNDNKINIANLPSGLYISIAKSNSGMIINSFKFYKN